MSPVLIAAALLFALFAAAGCGGGGNLVQVHQAVPAPLPDTGPHEVFDLVVVPDTQYEVADMPAIFMSMMNWTVTNRDTLNIKFLLHEGDITNRHLDAEFQKADEGFTLLENAGIPYALGVGNHDMAGTDASRFNSYFPVSRYESLPTFGGVFEPGEMKNAWHKFSAGGTDWMIVVLEYNPRDSVLAWASDTVAANPTRRAIILTHAYLLPNGTRGSIGNNIWNKLAKLHKNISFVFNGHYTDSTSSRLVSAGDHGNNVYQMFCDYQDELFGGTGLLRYLRFDRDARTVSVKTFSASSNFFRTGDADQFDFTDVDLGPPL